MRSLLLLISILAGFTSNGQDSRWYFTLNTGSSYIFLNDLHSDYTPYFEGYAKVPHDLPGFAPEYPGGNNSGINPAGGSLSVPFVLEASFQINARFSGSIGYQTIFGDEYVNTSVFTSSADGATIEYTSFMSKTYHSVYGKVGFQFNNLAVSSKWRVFIIAGTSYLKLDSGYKVDSERTTPGVFNGTAEEYIKRSDWAFTWGGGISYTYMFGKHWGVASAFELTTFNLKPESATRYSYKINGEELVEILPIREQQILFSNEFPDRPDEPNAAQVLPPENYRYIVPQITLGVVYAL